MAAYLLGVDGGGTKTIALVATSDGVVVGRGSAGASNHQAVGQAAMFAALESAIGEACAQAGADSGAIAAACLGLAGADRPEDRALVDAWARARWPHARLTLANDAALLLAASTPDGYGLALVSGTGSIAYGRSRDGATARAGGWGYVFGDEGSGYAIGVAALRAVAQAADGRGPATALTRALLAHWNLATPSALIARVYRGGVGRVEIAALARIVDGCADTGDSTADAILRAAGDALAHAAVAVQTSLRWTGALPCALAGGVLLGSARVREHMLARLHAQQITLDPCTRVDEPACGALAIAARGAF
jgi:N-acetylmuramic acid 6-phosphate etherase